VYTGILSKPVQKSEGDCQDLSRCQGDSCPIVSSSIRPLSPPCCPSVPTVLNCLFLPSLSSPFSPSPLDPEGIDTTSDKPLFYRHLRADDFRENRTMKESELITEKKAVGRPRKTGIGWCYVPTNFNDEDKAKLGDLLESSYCVFQLLHLFRVSKGQPKDDWIDLAYDYCDDHILNWSKTIKRLLDKGILERTKTVTDPYGFGIEIARGEKGGRAYGYRFQNEAYRQAIFRKVQITNPKILARLEKATNIKYPVQRWLVRNLKLVEIDDVPDEVLKAAARRSFTEDGRKGTIEGRVNAYREQIRWIRDKSWHHEFDERNRRFYSNVANLVRELRAYLRIGGSPLVEIDIKNSQPLFIGLMAQAAGVNCDEYLRLCEADLYQHLADKGGFTRSEVKQQLMKRALFSSNHARAQRLPVKRLFDKLFPQMAEFIREQKKGQRAKDDDKQHGRFAIKAQYQESRFIIYSVCERIRKERPDCWIATIHDSVLTLPDNLEYVLAVMKDEFARLGVAPQLEPRQPGT
jgi:hypothetical protein